MRSLLLVAALLSVLSPAAAKAEVLVVCGDMAALKAGYPGGLGAIEAESGLSGTMTPLALWHDAKGFDVVLNWGLKDQHSLRAEGADIMANELGTELIHLLVARPGTKNLEHFVFSLNDDAAGELIWDASSDAPESDNELVTACFKPKH